MSLVEEAIQNAGARYVGGQQAPIGSFWNPRTNCVFQQAADGALPACGVFVQITNSGTSTLSQCATACNGLVAGLNYTSANLHTYTSADLSSYPGQNSNDG